MSDSSSWSLQLGRWFGLHVQVHALFVGVAVFALYLSTSGQQAEAGYGALAVGILFVSVLAHELAHAWAAARVGGSAERITIGPLGGLSCPEVPRESQPELITALAGPIANLGILLVALPMLAAANLGVVGLLRPLAPEGLVEGAWWEVALKQTFWINGVLVMVNLLPAFPFDGAWVLRTLLWPALDHRTASLATVRVSKLTAVGICILAWLLEDSKSAEILPAWVPLVLLAAMVYFCSQHEAARLESGEWDEELFSYDFSQGYTSLERAHEAPRRQGNSFRRWLETRRELRQRRRQWQEQEEERQVDDILMRLHETGMESLSAKERAILDRVSARYRNRQRN